MFREKSIKFKHAWTEIFAFIIILKVSETKQLRELNKNNLSTHLKITVNLEFSCARESYKFLSLP